MKFYSRSTDVSGSSYRHRPQRRGRSSSRGKECRACSKPVVTLQASRRIGAKSAYSSHCLANSDTDYGQITMYNSSSSGTEYTDTSTFSYSIGSDSQTSTDESSSSLSTSTDESTSLFSTSTDESSSSLSAVTYDSNSSTGACEDESLYVFSAAEYDWNTSTDESSDAKHYSKTSTYARTDESSYFLADSECCLNTSTDKSSNFLSDTKYDADTSNNTSSDPAECDAYYTSTAASSHLRSDTPCSSYTSASGSPSDREYDSYGSIDESLDSLANTNSSYYTSTYEKAAEEITGTEKNSLKMQKSCCRAGGNCSTNDCYYSDTGKSTKSQSSEKSSSYTKSSTGDFYSGKLYDKSRQGFKRCSSGRKRRTSMSVCATTTFRRNYRPSTFKGQYLSRASYCACAGGGNKKHRYF